MRHRFCTLFKMVNDCLISHPRKDQKASYLGLNCWFSAKIGNMTSTGIKSIIDKTAQRKLHTSTLRAPPWNVMFFGSDDYSLPHLKKLHQDMIGETPVVSSLKVVVPKQKQGGRKCEVLEYSHHQGLPVQKWPVSVDDSWQCDVGVVVSFGHLIPNKIIQAFPYGILNVHPSLLPRWRGSAPIIHTILSGDTETAVSVMRILPHKFDIGPILLQQRFPVPKNITSPELSEKLSHHGASLLLQTLKDLVSIEPKSQTDSEVTHAWKITPHHARISWEEQSVEDVYRQYRALSHMFPLSSLWQDKVIKFGEMRSLEDITEIVLSSPALRGETDYVQVPGTPFYHKPSQTLCVKCRDGWVGFNKVTIKKPMTAKAFYNGYLNPGLVAHMEARDLIFISQENGLNQYY